MKNISKKIFSLLLILALVLPNFNFLEGSVAKAAGGSGTISDPYLISTPAEFNNIRNNLTASYKLTSDIDLSGYTDWVPIGGSFTGNLDGNGYTIKNLKISSTTTYRGLFYSIASNSSTSGIIKDLKIDAANVVGNNYTGILAGAITGTSSYRVKIANVEINGSVNQNTSTTSVGGVVGNVTYADFNNIKTNINMDIKFSGSASYYYGVLAGYAANVKISDSVINGSAVYNKPGNTDMYRLGGALGYAESSNINNVRVNVPLKATFLAEGATTWTFNAYDIGGVVGFSNSTNITDTINFGSVELGNQYGMYRNSFNIGGIAGNATTSKLQRVVNRGTIDLVGTNTSTNYYTYNVGGLIGNVTNSKIFSSLNAGNIHFIYPTTWSTVSNIGGLVGNGSGGTGLRDRVNDNAAFTILDSASTGNIVIQHNAGATNIGGVLGNGSYLRAENNYSTGSVSAINYSGTARNNSNVGGYAGSLNDNSNQSTVDYPNIRNVYSSSSLNIYNGGGASYSVSGLISYKYINMLNSFYTGTSVVDSFSNSSAYQYTTFHYNVYGTSGIYVNSDQTTNVNNNGAAGTYTTSQLKQWSTYASVGWSSSKWGIIEGSSFPYLKNLGQFAAPTTNSVKTQQKTMSLKYNSGVTGNEGPSALKIKVEELRPESTTWKSVGIYDSSSLTAYNFNIPAGTPGNTKFRWTVAAVGKDGVIGEYYPFWTEFTFENNVTKIDASFDNTKKDFSTSLTQRTMDFTLDNVTDPDTFSYVKIFAEIEEVSGSKKQLNLLENTDETGIVKHGSLTGGWAAPISDTEVQKYKLKILPNFDASANNFDLVVVDAEDEEKILATLIDDRKMQNIKDNKPETFTLKLYAEDYQKELGTKLATSDEKKIQVNIDTRNYLPSFSDMTDDVNGRIMSVNQGFNKIKFTGNVTDFDPNDDLEVFYTVKSLEDLTDGEYQVDPNSDVKIASFKSSDYSAGVNKGDFTATYTVSDDLSNGSYVIVVYAKDHRDGFGLQHVIKFDINKTDPDIKFFANYGGNVISTAQRQVVTKDSKLKMYFSAYDYVTFEYAGYLVKAGQQKSDGTYEDLKIRGAFTNDVKSSFIGVDLTNDQFAKGDMLVFKFRAVSATGVKVEKDVRVLIGDESFELSKLSDEYLPTKLRITN